MQVSSSARLSSVFLLEERRGIAWSMQGRLIALSVIAIWLSIDNFGADTFYFLGLLGCFATTGIILLWLSRSESYAPWMKYAFMTVDAALLSFTLLFPSPFRDFVYDIQLQLRFGNFPYFFVIFVGIAALTYSPRFVIAAALICAVAWSVGASFIIFRPDTLTFRDILPDMSSDEISRVFLDPKFVAANVRVTEVLTLLIVAGILASAASRARQLVLSQTETERQRTNLARYLSPNMLDQLASTDEPFSTVREQHAAVLFVDIVGFTSMSTGRPPHEVIDLLREFHSRMAQTVFAHDGTLDKFIGDAVMATFGTPTPREDDPDRALRCAQAMLESVRTWSDARSQAGQEPVRVGIGLHYGPVVTGDIGDHDRLEFAVLGDTVNVASRLERLARDLDVTLVVSNEAIAAADGAALQAKLERHGDIALRGREQLNIDVWTLRS